MATDKELIETHLAHVRESLHDLRDQMGAITLLSQEMHEVRVEMRQLTDLAKQVQRNRDDILKVKTIGGFMGLVFTVIVSLLGIFKR